MSNIDIESHEYNKQFMHEASRLAIDSSRRDTSKIGFDDEFQYIDFRLPLGGAEGD
jgi:hypothetical protein